MDLVKKTALAFYMAAEGAASLSRGGMPGAF